MGFVTTRDGTEIYYHDWGSGPPVLFSHGYPQNADVWQDQMKAVADAGYRAIAHDRRGHGRSSQPYSGYDFDTFADDLADLVEALDLTDMALVGHSMGGFEVARYVGRYGTGRISKIVLLGAATPLLVQTEANPGGVAKEALEGYKDRILEERSQFWLEAAEKFYGANRPGNKATDGIKYAFWLMAMQQNIQAGVACVDAFGYTDVTEDLRRFDVPTLIVHGDDDQYDPVDATAKKTAELVPYANLKIYEGGSHGLASVPGHKERFNRDLLEFLGS